MGLDPGLDHMTASEIIHSIQRVAAIITSFKSYCGGLVAPESDNTPWHYKVTWNPKNIVTAGMAGGRYLLNEKQVEVPYEELFNNPKKVKIGDYGMYAYYPNRDSLDYIEAYDLPEATNFLRATLRHPTFCKGWQALIDLGLNDDKEKLNTAGMTYIGWLKQVTKHSKGSIQQHIAKKLDVKPDDKVISMLQWLGVFDERMINQKKATSSQVLLELVSDKMQMNPKDKDMVLMQHEVEYIHKGNKTKMISTMMLKGENSEYTAMAKAVGLPMAILAKFVLTNKIRIPTGVLIPNMSAVYRPILTELNHHGIEFKDEVVE
jgi:saccharopine dehydrogenase-like NADP-dependent oxidoreductase